MAAGVRANLRPAPERGRVLGPPQDARDRAAVYGVIVERARPTEQRDHGTLRLVDCAAAAPPPLFAAKRLVRLVT